MVKRVDVEYLLEMAKQCGDETQAELCRAWLALDAAPVLHARGIGTSWQAGGQTTVTFDGVQQGVPLGRVRLVATPASGGPRDG